MFRYLKYLFFGLVLMAPQEWSTSMFKSTVRDFPFHFFYFALGGWAVMLSIAWALYFLMGKVIRHEGPLLAASALVYLAAALGVEWGLLGNSPAANPGANQLGLVAAWVSVFTLPRMFLDAGFRRLKKWTIGYYVFFVFSVVAPVFIWTDGPIKGVIFYGYTVIPFLFFTLWYVARKWRDGRRATGGCG